MDRAGVSQVRVIPATGAEKFAEYIYNKLNEFVKTETDNRVELLKLNLWSMEKMQLITANKIITVNKKPLKKIIWNINN